MTVFPLNEVYIPQLNICTQAPLSSSALIAGVVVSLLVVLLLLSLVGGVLAVVVKARIKKDKETVHSQSKVEDESTKMKDITDNAGSCQNVRGQPTQTTRHYENTYDYATAEYAFINPASATATASFSANVYDSTDYSEVDQRLLAAGGEGHCEEFRVEEKWSGGRCNEDPIKGVISKQKKSALKDNSKVLTPEELYAQPDKAKKKKNASTKVMKPEELYAQPDKAKKRRKNMSTEKDIEVTSEEVAAPCDDLYAQPDMTKKKNKRSQQHWEQESEERQPVPAVPLPYKKHVEVMQETDEDEEDIPEVPPPFVPDGEQYYNTRGGDGPSTQDSNYDYAVVDSRKK